MSKLSPISVALSDLKMIQKRIDSKQAFILQYLTRPEQLKDPLFREVGGAAGAIERELQACADLRQQAVAIRRAIAEANAKTEITVNGTTRTIADWLRWRRDIAPGERDFVRALVSNLDRARQQALAKGGALISATANSSTDNKPSDIVVNLNEMALSQRREELEAVLEQLDGQLSLKNATVNIEY